jgi:hypothetical protein
VKTLEWYEHPHQDARWYEQQRALYRASGMEEQFEVEFLRNASAGSGRLVYHQQVKLCPFTDQGYDRTRMLKASVDPGVVDNTAFVFWQTHEMDDKKRIRLLDGCQLDKVPVEFWAHVLTGIPPEPGDKCYPLDREGYFDEGNLRDIMAWLAGVPPGAIHLVGDPSITRRAVTHESWVSVFERVTRELRQRAYGEHDPRAIPVMVNLPAMDALTKRNNFQDRRVGARKALMMMEFCRTPGALAVREAVENTMFQETTERSIRPPGHIHDRYSDYVQAFEYGMTWETLELTPDEVRPLKPATPEKPQTARRGTSGGRSAYQRARKATTLVGIG